MFKCLLIGNESLLVQCGQLILDRGNSIAAIVTSNDAVKSWAGQNGIPSVEWRGSLEHAVESIDYDYLFSIANLRIIPSPVWRKARLGAINFHDGPLPRYAGLNVPAWAVMQGETRFGVTWHEITDGVDEGCIHMQADFDLSANDTSLSLNTKCFAAGIDSFAALLDAIATSSLPRVAQDLSVRTYYAKTKRPDAAGTLLLDLPAEQLSSLFRGLNFGSGYANRLVCPKLKHEAGIFIVRSLTVRDTAEGHPEPGVVLAVEAEGVVIATGRGSVLLEAVKQDRHTEIKLSDCVRPGDRLPLLSEEEINALTSAVGDLVRQEDHFVHALRSVEDVKLVDVADQSAGETRFKTIELEFPADLPRDGRVAAIVAFLARLSTQDGFDIAYAGPKTLDLASRFPGYFAEAVPLHLQVDAACTAATLRDEVAANIARLRERGSHLADLFWRHPDLAQPHYSVGLVDGRPPSDGKGLAGCALTFVIDEADAGVSLIFDDARLPSDVAYQYARRIKMLAAAFATDDALVAEMPLMTDVELDMVQNGWNNSARPVDPKTCMHTLIEQQVAKTPDAIAIAWRDEQISYRDMDERANRIAQTLIAMGVGPDTMVGLNIPRCTNLVVAALAIQKAGGAYLPLDPNFPTDRLSYMVKDSRLEIILSSRMTADALDEPGTRTVFVEDILAANLSAGKPEVPVSGENLAYVIYTSGSTGRPKGVMVEHRNVTNFFVGMDERISYDRDRQPVWLAVTSLSFDISVLELFWTLARGFKVIIHASQPKAGKSKVAGNRSSGSGPMDFGLFYWGNDDGAGPAKYQLLLEGAKFADNNGFQSIWTPERHFHAFGGPYPNPAVTGAAVAAITSNLSIRAGSCVLPLHHPIRIAEEWAVIDNLSNGRVALAFASGWMPEDFVLRPENAPPNNKTALIQGIETVRRLWRGERMEFDFGHGMAGVLTQPRPVQSELPVWLTTAGNPETYREAARAGTHVLTHLLGQSIDELASKIKIYRETLVECGRSPSDFKVTLMLHTLLGDNLEEVREAARGPMKAYLKSAAALIKQYAWAFPAFKKPAGATAAHDIDLQSLNADELDSILEFAFLRYFEDSGLFGTIDDAMARIRQLEEIGVDEVACLIDFGVPSPLVLERLVPLAKAVAQARTRLPEVEVESEAASFHEDVRRHGVTHLQCTPSMIRMFLINGADRAAFSKIAHLFVGGEALTSSLLQEIRTVTDASVENMYGPTETTIWSSTMTADMSESVVPLGLPIANTQLYVLDPAGRLTVPGQPGELYIGGDGVTRGYLHREDLTRERFLPNPFAPGRIYRTGDLVCRSQNGKLRFLGRTDHQVKVRGYRIELGEIEAVISAYPGVAEAVVIAREDRADDVRIVAYLRMNQPLLDEESLRRHLSDVLPDYMVPAHFVVLDAFPMTPNAKVDRKALPKPEVTTKPLANEIFVAPENTLERDLAEAYRRTLGLDRVGLNDNFFAIGGHSLLAVQLHRDLKASIAPDLTITDVFRFPTVGTLAAHLADRGKADERLSQVADRAATRRAALGDRRAALSRPRT
ncbi:MAG: MupA/Atu3671 family FMN-dependent luciferase-like monooxygenase [Allorhizobium sp.]